MFKKISLIGCLFISVIGISQKNSNEVLFTVENKPITTSEFTRVYNKNLDLVKDESQRDVDNYLQLYINYQLKLKEAKRLKLHEDAAYLKEFESYKQQLLKNYSSDAEVTDELVKEAYNRTAFDINASHILVRIDLAEKDTVIAYNKIKTFRERALTEGFDNVRALVHDGQTIYGEELGYFSAFKMVYDFETVAYNTPIGEISEPFRTQFGYHIVNVKDKRPSRGEVTVAHIMISLNQTDESVNPEVRINEIYKKLNQGETFEALAKQFSDDKSSANKGGALAPFKGGQLSALEFEDVAFSLKDKNQVSQPFKTQYGWHIVKLLDKKPLQSFEELKSELQNRVQRDSRSKLINKALVNKLKNKYVVTSSTKNLTAFENILTPDYFNKTWRVPENIESRELFKIDSISYASIDFAKHLENSQKNYFGKTVNFDYVVKTEYNNFLDASILKYHEDHLEFTNLEYANILNEYRDGLLLFDLMEKEVWNKAMKDSVGLLNYYENHKSQYTWSDRVDVVVATSASPSDVALAQNMMKEGLAIDDINTKLNTNNQQKVIFTKGIYATNDDKLPSDLVMETGVSKMYHHNDAHHVFLINKIIPATTKSFEEAKGQVVNDYQTQIETKWLEELRLRYPVQVNQKALNKVKSQLK